MSEQQEEKRIIDLDQAFDRRVADYFAKSKHNEEEWEELVPQLYKKFADTKIKALDATPNEYYRRMSPKALLTAIRARFAQGVCIDGFLRAAAEDAKNRAVLLALLQEDCNEAAFAVEILGADREAYEEYIRLLSEENFESLRGEIVDILKDDADFVCERLLETYSQGLACDCVADILSYCLLPREEVFFVLLDEFLKTQEGVEAAVNRLARYGDERALSYIKEKAMREETGYLDWRALCVAAEALGERLAPRDFSKDEEYLTFKQEEIRQQTEQEENLAKE